MFGGKREPGQQPFFQTRRQESYAEERGYGKRQTRHPAAQAQRHGARGELPGDVGVLGTDQVKNLYGLLMNGETGARRENYGPDGRRPDENQDGGGQGFHGANHAHQAGQPDAVVVDGGTGNGRGEAPRKGRHIGLGIGCQGDVDELRQGQIGCRLHAPQPRLKKRHETPLVKGFGIGNAGQFPKNVEGRP